MGWTCGLAIVFILVLVALAIWVCVSQKDDEPKKEKKNKDNKDDGRERMIHQNPFRKHNELFGPSLDI